jgi:hypothetical protein
LTRNNADVRKIDLNFRLALARLCRHRADPALPCESCFINTVGYATFVRLNNFREMSSWLLDQFTASPIKRTSRDFVSSHRVLSMPTALGSAGMRQWRAPETRTHRKEIVRTSKRDYVCRPGGADEHLVPDADGRLCSQETLQERERPCIYKSIAPVRQPVTVALFDSMI